MKWTFMQRGFTAMLSVLGDFSQFGLTTDALFTKTQEQTVVWKRRVNSNPRCVFAFDQQLRWTICQNRLESFSLNRTNLEPIFSKYLKSHLNQLKFHCRVFFLSAPTLTADIYSSWWAGSHGSCRAEIGGLNIPHHTGLPLQHLPQWK